MNITHRSKTSLKQFKIKIIPSISAWFIWFITLLKSSVFSSSLWMFYSFLKVRFWIFFTIMSLSLSPFSLANICFLYLGALRLSAYIFIIHVIVPRVDWLLLCKVLICLLWWFWFKVYFIRYNYNYFCSLFVTICMELFSHPFASCLCVSLNLKWFSHVPQYS